MEILTKVAMQHKGSNMKFDNLKLLLWTDESSLGVVLTLVSFFSASSKAERFIFKQHHVWLVGLAGSWCQLLCNLVMAALKREMVVEVVRHFLLMFSRGKAVMVK